MTQIPKLVVDCVIEQVPNMMAKIQQPILPSNPIPEAQRMAVMYNTKYYKKGLQDNYMKELMEYQAKMKENEHGIRALR